jgi:hypothetical protein
LFTTAPFALRRASGEKVGLPNVQQLVVTVPIVRSGGALDAHVRALTENIEN